LGTIIPLMLYGYAQNVIRNLTGKNKMKLLRRFQLIYNRWQIRRIDRRIDKIRRARFY
jgi:hypothetical protein